MAKTLQFQFCGSLYEAEPRKVERKKIYGYKEISAIDSNGNDANPKNHTIRKQDYDKKTEESEKIAKTKPCVENLNLLICTNADKMKSHKDYKEAKIRYNRGL